MPKTHDRTSASQLKTAALCPRKWWFEKLSDLPKPEPTRALIEGSAIHKQVEDYLKHGTTPIDLRASALTRHYPPRSHGNGRLISEQEVKLSPTDTGLAVPLLGFIDLVDLTALPHTLGIVDFKTVGDWKWAKTEEELRTDLQMVPYAVWALNTYKPNAVSVAHLQVHKATAQTAEVSAVLDTRHTRKVWSETIVPLSHRMAEWATLEVTKVPAVVQACGAFGGCPYLSHCQRGQANPSSPSSPFANIGRIKASTIPTASGETPMSKLQDLIRARAEKAALAKAEGTPPTPSSIPTGAPALAAAIAAVDEAAQVETPAVKATPAVDEVAFRLDGRTAHAAGEERESPYKEGSAKDLAWLEGWDSAAVEVLEAQRVLERAAQVAAQAAADSDDARALVERAEAQTTAEAMATALAQAKAIAEQAGTPIVAEQATTAPPGPRAVAHQGFDYPVAEAAIERELADGKTTISSKDLRAIVGSALDLQRVAWSHVERATVAWPGALTLKGLDLSLVGPTTPTEEVTQAVALDVVARAEAPARPAAGASVTKAEPVEVVKATPTETPTLPEGAAKGFGLLVDIGIVVAPKGWAVQTMEAYLAPIIASYEKSTGGPAFLRDFRAGERTVAHMASLALPADGTLLLVDSMNGVWKEVSQALVPTAAFVLRGTR